MNHLEERFCGHKDVGKSAVAMREDIQIQPMSNDIETVAEFMRKERLTQSHGAKTFREIDVAPAAFLFDFQKTHIEWCIVCDENGTLCKLQELWQYGVDGSCMRDILIADLMNLFCFPWDRAFRIDESYEGLIFANDAVLNAYARDFNDFFPLQRIKTGRFEIENRERREGGHGHGL